MRWYYQEWHLEWSLWGLGWQRDGRRGWSYDELILFIGPVRIVLLGG